jgi:hypothetical protein
MARTDNMKKNHLPFCQPELAEGDSGLLKVGDYPRENVDEFRMLMRLIGVPLKPTKADIHKTFKTPVGTSKRVNSLHDVELDDQDA